MNKIFTRASALTLLSALIYNQAALSATATASFPVSATVQPSCSLRASSLIFGSYTGVAEDSTAVVTVRCNSEIPLVIGLNAGRGPRATTDVRVMTSRDSRGNENTDNVLNYTVYQNRARTQVWGDINSADALVITAEKYAEEYGSFILYGYGRIFAGQSPNPTIDNLILYTDTITVTVSY